MNSAFLIIDDDDETPGLARMSPADYEPFFMPVLDVDAAAYISAVETADGQALENTVKLAIHEFVTGCKEDSSPAEDVTNWQAIKSLHIFGVGRTLAGSYVALKGNVAAPASGHTAPVEDDLLRGYGIKGDAIDKAISVNRSNNADPQNNFHLAVWVSEPHTAGGIGVYVGQGSTGEGATHIGTNTEPASTYMRCRGATLCLVTDTPLTTGFLAMVRTAAEGFTAYTNDDEQYFEAVSTTPPVNNLWTLCRNINTSFGFTNGCIGYQSIGEAVDGESLRVRVRKLMGILSGFQQPE